MITFLLIPDLEVFQLFSITESGISQYKLKVVVLETFFLMTASTVLFHWEYKLLRVTNFSFLEPVCFLPPFKILGF